MARATRQKAGKDYPEDGIKKGEMYWRWSIPFGGVHRSKTQPRPSQLTKSEYLGAVYSLQEDMGSQDVPESPEDLAMLVDDWAQRARDIGEEQQEKFENMPEGLQQGETGQLLERRAEAMENWASEMELVDVEFDVDEAVQDAIEAGTDYDDQAESEWLAERFEELTSIEPEIE